jgi:hypothetical protein
MRSSTILRRRARCRWKSSPSARRSPARSRSSRRTVSLGGSLMTLPILHHWRAVATSGHEESRFPKDCIRFRASGRLSKLDAPHDRSRRRLDGWPQKSAAVHALPASFGRRDRHTSAMTTIPPTVVLTGGFHFNWAGPTDQLIRTGLCAAACDPHPLVLCRRIFRDSRRDSLRTRNGADYRSSP